MAARQAPPKLLFKSRHDTEVYTAAQKAVRKHVAAVALLRTLNVLRTGRAVQSDFAEWIAAKILHLDLSPNSVQQAYDAIDGRGAKYQIKSRVTLALDAPTSFDFRRTPRGFDFLVAVFFDQQYRVLGIARIPRRAVVALGSQTTSRFSFRWNKRTMNDTRIAWIVPSRIDAA